MKIGLYGGTFDPLHWGHIHLAMSLKEKAGLDEVWFCPAGQSPFKQDGESTSPKKRLEMVRLGVEGIPGFKVIDEEVRRSGASYTVDTLESLHKAYPNHEFYLLMGNDTAKGFLSWKNPGRIIELAKPLIGKREMIRDFPLVAGVDMQVLTVLMEGMVESPTIQISSTDIRARSKKGLYIGHLVPQKVMDYILDNSLYS